MPMWCIYGAAAAYHEIRGDKLAASFERLLSGFFGSIVCDAATSHTARRL